MGKNIGWLTASRSPESDECMTPQFVVHAIAKYIPLHQMTRQNTYRTKVLCPFDKDEHAFPKVFRKLGYGVVNTHFDPLTGEGLDFFKYTKGDMEAHGIDFIVSNPPFSKKDEVLEHCDELGVPYALLLPLPTLQGQSRFDKVFSKGYTQVLIFNARVPYSAREKHWSSMSGNHFASIFICKGILPEKLIFDKLEFAEDEG